MKLFVNPYTDIIVPSDYINAIPIDITTPVKILDKMSSIEDTALNDEGKKLYIKDNEETTDKYTIEKFPIESNPIDFGECTILGDINTIDENIYPGIITQNKNAMKTVYKYKTILIDEQNAIGKKAIDILSKEYINLLEDSNYDNLIIDILQDNILLFQSSFYSYNKYRVILSTNDKLVFNITTDGLNITSGLKMFGLKGSGATLYINNILVSPNSNGDYVCNLVATTLNIEIRNYTAGYISITEPFILYT